MAKQIAGLCRFEGTMHGITFYKMDGQYYARAQSSLTSERVKTSDEFKWTMAYASLLARASKIGSQIYKALPPGWRQFWMYRSFTGEAFTLLKKNPYTDEQVKQILWKCYVEYWEQIKAVDPNNPIFQPKPKKIRKRRVVSLEAMMRKRDKYGKPKYPELIKAEKERKACEAKEAWIKKLEEKKRLATELSSCSSEKPADSITVAREEPGINHAVTPKEPATSNLKPATLSTWHITAEGTLYTGENFAVIHHAAALGETGIHSPPILPKYL
ncbi:hypothetical protein HB364_24945 [Pseudoflavitalea sp. X16]|uniref:hypothetical protein n=1 Tax=Paraflavitalea devenefica TaxID=2716334 RepID=UPI001421D573|nr:hypothetical protein [Paraflavitalea devenefica]NII28354.1 hypothetical protein [Paraflavitalea devenefica]